MYDARMVTGRLDVTSGRYTGMCCIVETDSKTVTDATDHVFCEPTVGVVNEGNSPVLPPEWRGAAS